MVESGFYRLLAWLSPGYPVGAYAHSHGLEWAVEAGLVRGRADLVGWLEDLLGHGGGRSDAVLFARAFAAAADDDRAALVEIAELAHALAPTAELHLETAAQGAAFARATLDAWPDPEGRLAGLLGALPEPPAYPVAVAAACAAHRIGPEASLLAYLHAFAANLVSAAVRLVPLGQTDGQRALAALAPAVDRAARAAPGVPLEALGTAALVAEWCSMRHETQYTRLFRS